MKKNLNIQDVNITSDSQMHDLAEFFKIFGDTTRIKIIHVLTGSELCVNDIADSLNMQQSAISHQLRILKEKRVVKHRREGKSVFYSLDDNHVKNIFCEGFNHITEK